VQLEALACGVPVAAFPVTGPKDVIGGNLIGALDEDLRAACLAALRIPRAGCRDFALARSWESSARQFIGHVQKIAASVAQVPEGAMAVPAVAQRRI
jgi:glycosyltransferase involved in cell wall biosynthesis